MMYRRCSLLLSAGMSGIAGGNGTSSTSSSSVASRASRFARRSPGAMNDSSGSSGGVPVVGEDDEARGSSTTEAATEEAVIGQQSQQFTTVNVGMSTVPVTAAAAFTGRGELSEGEEEIIGTIPEPTPFRLAAVEGFLGHRVGATAGLDDFDGGADSGTTTSTPTVSREEFKRRILPQLPSAEPGINVVHLVKKLNWNHSLSGSLLELIQCYPDLATVAEDRSVLRVDVPGGSGVAEGYLANAEDRRRCDGVNSSGSAGDADDGADDGGHTVVDEVAEGHVADTPPTGSTPPDGALLDSMDDGLEAELFGYGAGRHTPLDSNGNRLKELHRHMVMPPLPPKQKGTVPQLQGQPGTTSGAPAPAAAAVASGVGGLVATAAMSDDDFFHMYVLPHVPWTFGLALSQLAAKVNKGWRSRWRGIQQCLEQYRDHVKLCRAGKSVILAQRRLGEDQQIPPPKMSEEQFLTAIFSRIPSQGISAPRLAKGLNWDEEQYGTLPELLHYFPQHVVPKMVPGTEAIFFRNPKSDGTATGEGLHIISPSPATGDFSSQSIGAATHVAEDGDGSSSSSGVSLLKSIPLAPPRREGAVQSQQPGGSGGGGGAQVQLESLPSVPAHTVGRHRYRRAANSSAGSPHRHQLHRHDEEEVSSFSTSLTVSEQERASLWQALSDIPQPLEALAERAKVSVDVAAAWCQSQLHQQLSSSASSASVVSGFDRSSSSSSSSSSSKVKIRTLSSHVTLVSAERLPSVASQPDGPLEVIPKVLRSQVRWHEEEPFTFNRGTSKTKDVSNSCGGSDGSTAGSSRSASLCLNWRLPPSKPDEPLVLVDAADGLTISVPYQDTMLVRSGFDRVWRESEGQVLQPGAKGDSKNAFPGTTTASITSCTSLYADTKRESQEEPPIETASAELHVQGGVPVSSDKGNADGDGTPAEAEAEATCSRNKDDGEGAAAAVVQVAQLKAKVGRLEEALFSEQERRREQEALVADAEYRLRRFVQQWVVKDEVDDDQREYLLRKTLEAAGVKAAATTDGEQSAADSSEKQRRQRRRRRIVVGPRRSLSAVQKEYLREMSRVLLDRHTQQRQVISLLAAVSRKTKEVVALDSQLKDVVLRQRASRRYRIREILPGEGGPSSAADVDRTADDENPKKGRDRFTRR